MTRVLKFSAVAILAVLVLWACGGAALGAKETAEKFLKAVKTNDFGTAKGMVTKDTKGALEMYEGTAKSKPAGNAADIVVGEATESGETASVAYTDAGEAKTLELKKEGGSWKAVFVKPGGGAENLGETLGGALNEAVEQVETGLEAATEEMKSEGTEEGHTEGH